MECGQTTICLRSGTMACSRIGAYFPQLRAGTRLEVQRFPPLKLDPDDMPLMTLLERKRL